jgi:hypothetical protein
MSPLFLGLISKPSKILLAACLLYAGFLFGFIGNPEDERYILLQKFS